MRAGTCCKMSIWAGGSLISLFPVFKTPPDWVACMQRRGSRPCVTLCFLKNYCTEFGDSLSRGKGCEIVIAQISRFWEIRKSTSCSVASREHQPLVFMFVKTDLDCDLESASQAKTRSLHFTSLHQKFKDWVDVFLRRGRSFDHVFIASEDDVIICLSSTVILRKLFLPNEFHTKV